MVIMCVCCIRGGEGVCIDGRSSRSPEYLRRGGVSGSTRVGREESAEASARRSARTPRGAWRRGGRRRRVRGGGARGVGGVGVRGSGVVVVVVRVLGPTRPGARRGGGARTAEVGRGEGHGGGGGGGGGGGWGLVAVETRARAHGADAGGAGVRREEALRGANGRGEANGRSLGTDG